jgi:hypothetical protein
MSQMSQGRRQRRLEKKELLKSWKGRSCDGCTACCSVLGVTELGKSAYEECRHTCATGCSIYASRPYTCSTYACAWKIGALPEEFYPPKMGIVVDTTNELNVLTVREVVPGALQRREVKDYIHVCTQRYITVVIRGEDDRSILGPPDKVREFTKEVEKRIAAKQRAAG